MSLAAADFWLYIDAHVFLGNVHQPFKTAYPENTPLFFFKILL
jgi:hypothetical protein